MTFYNIWYNKTFIHIFLIPFSLLYAIVITIIRYIYRLKLCKTHYFPLPIVVVGNLTVGGNGKTPMVLWLVEKLKKRGWKVGVISRGYGGYNKKSVLVLNNDTEVNQCGDEPFLIWRRTKVLVAVAKQRYKAVIKLLNLTKLDVIVSDDGLQHYSLGRDIEIVVIDGINRFGNGWFLPAGPIRENIKRLKKVQAVIVNNNYTRVNLKPGELLMKINCNANVINLISGKKRTVTSLKTVVLIAGISHPSRFFNIIRHFGVIPVKEISFKDHQHYNQTMINNLITSEENLIMTEKDAVKCFSFAKSNWWYLPIEVQFSFETERYLLSMIESHIYKYLYQR